MPSPFLFPAPLVGVAPVPPYPHERALRSAERTFFLDHPRRGVEPEPQPQQPHRPLGAALEDRGRLRTGHSKPRSSGTEPGHHPPRKHPTRTSGAGASGARGRAPRHRQLHPRGDHRRPRRGQKHIHRELRAPIGRRRASPRRAHGRSVEQALEGQHPRRQDADGHSRGPRQRVHPSLPHRGHAGRRGS
jgi:hypothetical protein